MDEPHNTNVEPTGDNGGELCDEYPIQACVGSVSRLERRAIREKWPEPSQEEKQGLITRQKLIALSPSSKPREATAAFNALLNVTKSNNGDLTDTHGRPTVAIQQNFEGIAPDRPIDRKRTAEADMAEIRRARMAGETVLVADVLMFLEAFGRHIRQAIEHVQRISPEAAAIISDGIDRADREIGPLLKS